MTRSFFHYSTYILLLVGLFMNACSGQVQLSEEETNVAQEGPKIIGPLPTFHPGPLHDSTLVSQYIRCVFQDSKGHYWFGPASQSVVRYDGETLRYFSREAFFKGNKTAKKDFNSVHAIAEDQEGNLWFGTDHGAVKYDGVNFRSYTEEDGLTNTRLSRNSILVDQKGTIWVGTRGGVFRSTSLGDQFFSFFDLLPPMNVMDIIEDRLGKIWFASEDKGIFCYDGKTIVNITDQEGWGDNYAGGLAEDKEGNIWFTIKDGICKYDGQNFTKVTTKDGIGGYEIWGMLIEESGIIWITARGATTRFDPSLPISDPKAFTVYTEADGINCCVQSMYQDRLGNVWWGAGQGLYRFDGQRFYQVKQNGPW